jgi:hypothetical protein
MIEAIITALFSGAAAHAGKDLYKQVATRLRSFFEMKQVPEATKRLIDNLNAGHLDQGVLKEGLEPLDKDQLARLHSEVVTQSSAMNFPGATISGGTIIGIKNTFNNK